MVVKGLSLHCMLCCSAVFHSLTHSLTQTGTCDLDKGSSAQAPVCSLAPRCLLGEATLFLNSLLCGSSSDLRWGAVVPWLVGASEFKSGDPIGSIRWRSRVKGSFSILPNELLYRLVCCLNTPHPPSPTLRVYSMHPDVWAR